MEKIEFTYDNKKKKKYFYSVFLPPLLIQIFIISPLMLWYFGTDNFTALVNSFIGLFFYMAIWTYLPASILFYRYYNLLKNISLKREGQNYIFSYDGQTIYFTLEDIVEIKLYLTPIKYDDRTDFVFWGRYFYFSIYLNTGSVIHIPCLLLDNVDVLGKNHIKKVKKVFPLSPHRPHLIQRNEDVTG